MTKIKPETRYSQCSYNALATILNHFYGEDVVPDDSVGIRDGKRQRTEGFYASHLPAELKGYYGWIPYAPYVLKEMKERGSKWNETAIELEAEWFSIEGGGVAYKGEHTAKGLPVVEITFKEGEMEELTGHLAGKVLEGLCLLWIPNAAQWGTTWEGGGVYKTAIMPNTTHAIVLTDYDPEKGTFWISDGSVRDGIFEVPANDLISKLVAMPYLQKERDNAGKALKGIEGANYHSVIRKA